MKQLAAQIFVAGLLAAALVSTSALAEDARTPWFGSFSGLRTMPSDSDAELETRRLGTITGDIELSDATGFALAVGFETGGAQQVELEAAFRSFDIEGASAVRVGSLPVTSGFALSGDVDTWSLMFNARQLFDVGPVRPYIGGGFGFARHEGTAALEVPPSPLVPPGLQGKDSGHDTVVAYQLMAGVEVELGDGAQLFGGYRYMGTADIEIERLVASYDTHAIEVGIRIRF